MDMENRIRISFANNSPERCLNINERYAIVDALLMAAHCHEMTARRAKEAVPSLVVEFKRKAAEARLLAKEIAGREWATCRRTRWENGLTMSDGSESHIPIYEAVPWCGASDVADEMGCVLLPYPGIWEGPPPAPGSVAGLVREMDRERPWFALIRPGIKG